MKSRATHSKHKASQLANMTETVYATEAKEAGDALASDTDDVWRLRIRFTPLWKAKLSVPHRGCRHPEGVGNCEHSYR